MYKMHVCTKGTYYKLPGDTNRNIPWNITSYYYLFSEKENKRKKCDGLLSIIFDCSLKNAAIVPGTSSLQ